jgi:hypothetical protein
LIGHMPGSSIVNLYVTIYSDFPISSEFTLIYCRNISCIRIMCVLPIYVIYLLGPFVFHLVDYLNCFFIPTLAFVSSCYPSRSLLFVLSVIITLLLRGNWNWQLLSVPSCHLI